MTSSRGGAAGSATETPGTDPLSITESDDPFLGRPGPPAGPGTPGAAREPSVNGAAAGMGQDGEEQPLTESDAEEHVHGICFKTGPPGRIGVELEWLVFDGRDPALPVDQQRAATAVARLGPPGALPGRGMLTTEPGGQVEISSAPAAGPGDCIAVTGLDLAALRQAIHHEGLRLNGRGLDPFRPPRRVLEPAALPRRWRSSSTGPAPGAGP